MKEVTIISGKGGTGKTSVSASFAVLSKNCVLADCDVDAPNLHLLLEPKEIEKIPFFGEKKAKILNEKCAYCGVCLNLCSFGAIEESFIDNKFQIFADPLLCEGCGVCFHFCPYSAIEFKEEKSACLLVSETRCGVLVHAKMESGSGGSGKLVNLIKERARREAERKNSELVIVDGPPGLGCPVISSLSGASAAIVVTEPTQSAFNDLKRIYELISKFKIKTGAIINKCDFNLNITSQIKMFCQNCGIILLGEIPFDPFIPRQQSKKLTPVESGGKSSKNINLIYEKFIQTLLKED